jgi:hypothetical protein
MTSAISVFALLDALNIVLLPNLDDLAGNQRLDLM